MESSKTFFIRRLHSLLGIIPIGLFLLEHLITNSFSTGGADVFNDKVHFIKSLPLLPYLELFLIAVPLLFHGLYGLYIVYGARSNVLKYNYFRNWMFYLQRITALIAFVFVIWHAWTLRINSILTGAEFDFNTMVDVLSNPVIVGLYVIGLLSAVFHFANGLWAFLVSWGITIGPKAQKTSFAICSSLFVVLTVLGMYGLSGFVS